MWLCAGLGQAGVAVWRECGEGVPVAGDVLVPFGAFEESTVRVLSSCLVPSVDVGVAGWHLLGRWPVFR